MEVDLVTSGLLEEETVGLDDNNDNADFEGERCGICMDIIIDRGVLDCCQHWFCFACIDNWSTITNLCPLCQSEFQMITCVPVYDTLGSSKSDEESFSRYDDWCIEGRSNTLSFPSYYIDENAVICLGGDGCKIRGGSTTMEGDCNLDTSIACDSCDIWYHAVCVGFDPEGTSEDTWLCPRCAVGEALQKTDLTSEQKTFDQCAPENGYCGLLAEATLSRKVSVPVYDEDKMAVIVSMAGGDPGTKEPGESGSLHEVSQQSVTTLKQKTCHQHAKEGTHSEHFAEATFSGKVSVTLADEGETAVVVSMVRENQSTAEPDDFGSNFTVDEDLKVISYDPDRYSLKVEEPSVEKTIIQPILESQELDLSLSHHKSFSMPSNSLVIDKLKSGSDHGTMNKMNSSKGVENSSRQTLNGLCAADKLYESESNMDIHLGLYLGSFSPVNDLRNNATGDKVTGGVKLQNAADDLLSKAGKIVLDEKKDPARIIGVKRKDADCRSDGDEETKAKAQTDIIVKKIRSEGDFQLIPSKKQADTPISVDLGKCSPLKAVSGDDEMKYYTEKKAVTSDIMSIVQGTSQRSSKEFERLIPADECSKQRENVACLRVKKIMRRASEDKDSSIVVQKLRRDIREAILNKSSKDITDNLFEPKLLAAFRAAIAGPSPESVGKISRLAMKAKKSILQKGKVRENLTKKIYGNSNGRRKAAWDRDCEVEFWKHRCVRATKPEKIETLKSVLNLLQKSPEDLKAEQALEWESTNPILSRLYLADTSVFPRKDDIKPVSALKTPGNPVSDKEQLISVENKVLPKVGIPVTTTIAPFSKGNTASSKANLKKQKESSSSGTQREVVKSDVKPDTRKLALEVLARRKVDAGKNAVSGKQEDSVMLKGSYPLLAQLPVDMRPVLAASFHNKIPMSVRQTQLYRMAEGFLKKANLSEIRRTAETELAIADAVNIEKEVADKSNSKVVYFNLCSQEILHRSDDSKSLKAKESNPSPEVAVAIGGSKETADEVPIDPEVTDALRTAGLLSDSPPGSPHQRMEVPSDVDNCSLIGQEGPENVFEVDSHPEIDIYGDFEYDLADEDYIGATAMKVSTQPAEEALSKVKVVFSTLNSKMSNDVSDSEDRLRPENGIPNYSPHTLENHSGTAIGSFPTEAETKSYVLSESLPKEESGEQSDAECETLYGPDKQPLIDKFPELVEFPAENKITRDDENHQLNQSGKASQFESEGSSEKIVVASSVEGNLLHSQTSENVPRKEKMPDADTNQQNDGVKSVSKKVEAYIKEHMRPLCKIGVITAEQYRWVVAKTTDKVMKYHSKDKNANFLIKEGEKVKKLAEQYVEAAQQKEKSHPQ
ncbi:uncharacterized protein At4g10930 isoform X2 [Tripterygium wilfordii]|uniref:uncharacterized protein At4g10930 isoform X2 n=1 Tax=Tripterygium wilfordii TaxID=458696 RepID=UPI0018F7F332|nr:uncharacterized protein At4g10930 isoform X2 [Tripterygium wilfordii]